jgi:hypothetical protein
MRFRRFTGASGMTQKRVPDMMAGAFIAARRIWKSPWPNPEAARRFQNNTEITTI